MSDERTLRESPILDALVDAAVHELPATVLAAVVVEGEGASDGPAGAEAEVHGGVPVVGVAGHAAVGGGGVDSSLAVLAGPAVGAASGVIAGGGALVTAHAVALLLAVLTVHASWAGAGADVALLPSGLLVHGVAPWAVLGGIEVGDSAEVGWELAVGEVAPC